MARLTIFAKGNSDLVDSLFASQDGGGKWDGINEALRQQSPGSRVRLLHETFIRSDALVAATGETPAVLDHLEFDWPYGTASQFGTAVFDATVDAYVFSIQPDVTMKLLRHRATGCLFYLGPRQGGPAELREWLRRECEVAPLLAPEQALESWGAIVDRLRSRSTAPILFYNLSTVVPGDTLSDYRGLPETLTTRIKRFNLALVELSARTGVLIVDVDRLSARIGTDKLKLDAVRLNVNGSRFVAEEVIRLLREAQCLN